MAVDSDLDVGTLRVAASLAVELADVYAQLASAVDSTTGVADSRTARRLRALHSRIERIEIEIAVIRAACLVAA